MTIQLRIPTRLEEYIELAPLHNRTTMTASAPEALFAREVAPDNAPPPRRVIAVNSEQRIVGTSLLRPVSAPEQREYSLSVSTHPAHERQGIGSLLYADALQVAQAHAARLFTGFSDREPAAWRFAEQRGFALEQHWLYFRLDLTQTSDIARSDTIERVLAAGIRFFSLADVGNTPENQRKLYELNRRTSLDAPGEESFPTFEEFREDICQAPWFRADGQLLAAKGETWVGLAAVGLEGELAHNTFTGVERDYRRQHIAEALTLLSIRYARQQGARQLQVFNDSRNVGMLRMQETLGYQPIPGRYILTKPLSP